MRRPAAIALAVLLALAAARTARAYGWPIAPTNRQHPIRGYFGDPRTIYWDPYSPTRFPLNGVVSFHNGIDVSAPAGTRVLAVVSGVVRLAGRERILVRCPDGRRFQYVHVIPRVRRGQRVSARTVLGRTDSENGHVHLTEISAAGHAVDPLLPGHLSPYYDRTVPHVDSIELRTAGGLAADPSHVRGVVVPVALVHDEPAMAVPPPWSRMPVAPAVVRWSLRSAGRRYVVPPTTAVDFRAGLPSRRSFWHVYARGTYQNHPRFAGELYSGMPGRYLYRLRRRSLDTTRLPDGAYLLTVRAFDTRGNAGARRRTIAICNHDAAVCDRIATRHARGSQGQKRATAPSWRR